MAAFSIGPLLGEELSWVSLSSFVAKSTQAQSSGPWLVASWLMPRDGAGYFGSWLSSLASCP